METIHTRIKRLRIAKELSMEALGKAVDVSWQTVQQWEREDGTAPKRTRLKAVADALGTTPSFLMQGTGAPMASEPPPPEYLKNVSSLPAATDRHIAEAIAIMEATDEPGRIKAVLGIKFALKDHAVAVKNLSNS